MHKKQQKFATAIGFIAILLWSTLALFTSLTKGISPFQLLFLSFSIGATANLLWLTLNRQLSFSFYTIPKAAWLLSVGGLFFYHFFYFNALANAPEVEAGLIAYLWPLLIVLFSALLPKEKLRRQHILGALLAFFGAAALILFKGDSGSITFSRQHLNGYLFALACALTWSAYSVLNRRFRQVPSSATIGFCYLVAILGGLAQQLSGADWQSPTAMQWLGIIGLGVGPVGIAFFVWDYGTKHGNIQLLGTLSYFAPLLSTLLLIAFTPAQLTINVVLGCIGIILGALIAILPIPISIKTH